MNYLEFRKATLTISFTLFDAEWYSEQFLLHKKNFVKSSRVIVEANAIFFTYIEKELEICCVYVVRQKNKYQLFLRLLDRYSIISSLSNSKICIWRKNTVHSVQLFYFCISSEVYKYITAYLFIIMSLLHAN